MAFVKVMASNLNVTTFSNKALWNPVPTQKFSLFFFFNKILFINQTYLHNSTLTYPYNYNYIVPTYYYTVSLK